MKAILRAVVGSQLVVTGRQAGGGSEAVAQVRQGAHGLARSSSSKLSAVSWSTAAVQRLLRAKRPSNDDGGLTPRGRIVDTQQRAPLWPKLARRDFSSLVSWILGFVPFEPWPCPLEVALGRNSYKFWDIPRPRALSG